MHLEMNDLHLHPGDHKPLLNDEALIDTVMYDDEFDDVANQTFFDNIRYYFLVSVLHNYRNLKSCCRARVNSEYCAEVWPKMSYAQLGMFDTRWRFGRSTWSMIDPFSVCPLDLA